jgi:hypothetical protein
MTTDLDPSDPLMDLSSAARMGFIYQEYGEAGLHQLLDMMVSPTMPPEMPPELAAELHKWEPSSKEDLAKAADELAAMEHPAANVVAEYIPYGAPELECPFPESDPANRRDWHRRHRGIWQGYLKTPDTPEIPPSEDSSENEIQ